MSSTEFVAWLSCGTGLFVSLTVLLIRKGQRGGITPDLLVTIFLVGFIGVALVLVTKQGDSLAATNSRQRAIAAKMDTAAASVVGVEQRVVAAEQRIDAAEQCRLGQTAALADLLNSLAAAWSRDDETTRRAASQAVADNPIPTC